MAKTKTLIGFKRFTSKKNIPTCIATVCTKCDASDNERGAFGCSAEDVFLPSEMYSYLEIEDIGREVTLNYNVINGRAYINDFIVHRKGEATGKAEAAGK